MSRVPTWRPAPGAGSIGETKKLTRTAVAAALPRLSTVFGTLIARPPRTPVGGPASAVTARSARRIWTWVTTVKALLTSLASVIRPSSSATTMML